VDKTYIQRFTVAQKSRILIYLRVTAVSKSLSSLNRIGPGHVLMIAILFVLNNFTEKSVYDKHK